MVEIPASHADLLTDDVKSFAFLATVMRSGRPQVTPVWFNYKDGYLYINTAEGRAKDRNMQERPQVAVVIPDPKNMYRYIEFRGHVVEGTTEGADEHIHFLSMKYRGTRYTIPSGQVRVIYRIDLDKVTVKD